MIECNLCGQSFFDNEQIESQKKRHEERHARGRENGVNNIKGKVEWIDCD